jgi:RNA recognition motif-containing protein
MQIYIGNLSSVFTSDDLAPLFEGCDEIPSFTFKSYTKSNVHYYYALASIESESLAREVITRNQKKKIKNRKIEFHAYKDRSVFNERRAFGWGNKPWTSEERRKVDRRLVQEEIVNRDILKAVGSNVIKVQF